MGIAVQNDDKNVLESIPKSILSSVLNSDDVVDLGSEFSKLQFRNNQEGKNNASEGDAESDNVECADRENEQMTVTDKTKSSTASNRTLTTSFIKHIADTAHGMVACDLLQVAKEASFLSLDRYTSELKRSKEKRCDTNPTSHCGGIRDVQISSESGSRSGLGSIPEPGVLESGLTGEKENYTESKSKDSDLVLGAMKTHESEPEHSRGGGVEDGIYRPMNLISDYDDEEDEEEEDKGESEGEYDGIEQEEKDGVEDTLLEISDDIPSEIKEITIENEKENSSQAVLSNFSSIKSGNGGPKRCRIGY